ncbi:MAG: tetratricopeptide repeat protein [Acidobacteriia bacterium]|jgi:cytochrome c-type biogenesis protein CcmH/NrfG|nr:tetratricopeptide repeat protein [Terriglobia bacterium]
MKWPVPVLLAALLTAGPAVSAQQELETARQQFEVGRYDAVIATLTAALAKQPNNPEFHFWLARAYFELDDYNRAIQAAERAVALVPSNSEFHYWLARAYGRKASRERSFSYARKTKAAFEEAVRTDPNNIAARRALAEYYARAPWIAGGSDGKAREQCRAVARLDPVEGHLCWATYWLEADEAARAEQEYRRALALRPDRLESYLEVIEFYESRNDPAAMENVLRAAEALETTDPRLDYYRGVARVLAGDRLEQAEQFLQNYLARAPRRNDWPPLAAAHEWLGRLYEKQGRPREAAERYRAAIELDPRRDSARTALQRIERNL